MPDNTIRAASADGRVSAIEAQMQSYAQLLGRVERESREGIAAIDHKIDAVATSLGAKIDALATTYAGSRRTNWGNIFAGLSLVSFLTGGLFAAGILPLKQKDEQHDVALAETAAEVHRNTERVLRLDERLSIYREQGYFTQEPHR